MVIDIFEDAASAFPAASNALAVTEYVPAASAEPDVKLQSPLLSACVVPKELLPANNSTVLLASAVPVKVGVVSLVLLSVLEIPVSDEAARSGVEGGDGAVASTVIDKEADTLDTFPATSVAFAVMA